MSLEERTLDKADPRCEECGAELTDAELRAALEGGPNLCAVHVGEHPTEDELIDEDTDL